MGLYVSDFGATIAEIEPFTSELTGTVIKMQEELYAESKILEGTDVPEYGKGEWADIPNPRRDENELSTVKLIDGQWKKLSPSGSLTIDPIHTSILESNSSVAIASLFNRRCPRLPLSAPSTPLSDDSCSERLEDIGTETDATNGFSECTVPTISEQTDGTQSEAK